MDNQLKRIVYNARNKVISKDSALGMFAMIILSKEYLKYNFLVSEFIAKSIGVEFPDYVKKSRTLMCAKCLRILNDFSKEKLEDAVRNSSTFLLEIDLLSENLDNDHENKKNNSKTKKSLKNMNKWIEAINQRGNK